MPIERNQTVLMMRKILRSVRCFKRKIRSLKSEKLYYAVMNEDGTWGELIPLNETRTIRIELEWKENQNG